MSGKLGPLLQTRRPNSKLSHDHLPIDAQPNPTQPGMKPTEQNNTRRHGRSAPVRALEPAAVQVAIMAPIRFVTDSQIARFQSCSSARGWLTLAAGLAGFSSHLTLPVSALRTAGTHYASAYSDARRIPVVLLIKTPSRCCPRFPNSESKSERCATVASRRHPRRHSTVAYSEVPQARRKVGPWPRLIGLQL
jgi:hypothetical protein